jgi:hypothetical protein
VLFANACLLITPVLSWTTDEVLHWLTTMGMEQYQSLFESKPVLWQMGVPRPPEETTAQRCSPPLGRQCPFLVHQSQQHQVVIVVRVGTRCEEYHQPNMAWRATSVRTFNESGYPRMRSLLSISLQVHSFEPVLVSQ